MRLTVFSLPISDPSQTAKGKNDVHAGPARRAGELVRQDSLPGYLHEGRGGPEDQPPRIARPGEPLDTHVIDTS